MLLLVLAHRIKKSLNGFVFISPPQIGKRNIVMSVSSVCVCVCLSVRDHIFGTTRPTNFFACFLWLGPPPAA